MATEFPCVNMQPVMPAPPPPKPWYVQYFPELMIALDLAFVFGLALASLYLPKVLRTLGSRRISPR